MSRIGDVALAAGVSTATVSRALRGLPTVSVSTRERVLEAATRLDYVVSPTASSLASGKTRVVGVVVPYVTRWYFAQLIAAASRVLREHGYHVLLLDVGDNGPQRSLLIDQQMLWKRVDALLVFQLQLHDVEVRLLQRLGIPVVTVGTLASHWAGVRIDDVEVAVTATEHLIGLGHRDIAYVGGDPAPQLHFVTPAQRQQGFETTMASHGLAVPAARMVACDWTMRGGMVAGQVLLGARRRPTAIFAASDEIAMGVLMAARRLGIAVPGDLSVIGVDDHEMAFAFDLTTVRQPVPEQGEQASRLLLQALEGHPDASAEVVLATELVVRGSTAPPKSARPRSAPPPRSTKLARAPAVATP